MYDPLPKLDKGGGAAKTKSGSFYIGERVVNRLNALLEARFTNDIL
jgi:hypothetical protein